MEVSAHLKKRAKGYNTTWQNLVMADLIALGYGEMDSYIIAHTENAFISATRSESIRNNIQKSSAFQELLITRKKALSNLGKNAINDNGDVELIGAEETARELLKIAQSMPVGSKERGEMFVKYADLIRKNDTQTNEDDEPVRIYLPMQCTMCPHKQAADGKKEAKEEKEG